VLEFTTPFHVGAGREGGGLDALVVTDANGLPALPGSSLAGVLRAAFARRHGGERADKFFGWQTGDQGSGSRLVVSWGCLHDRHDRPLEGLRDGLPGDDPVLADALGLHGRDHVRLGHRGAAEKGGKFDERHVAAGHRFTCELELADDPAAGDADWQALLALLASGELRLGGKTRRGYGAFRVERLTQATFDLADPVQFAAYACHPASLAAPAPALAPFTPAPAASGADTVTLTLHLRPRGWWMFGGGEDLPPTMPGDGKTKEDPADMAPLRDRRIVWENGAGRVARDLLVLPATAIKGALAHRVAFHANRLANVWADQHAEPLCDRCGESNPAVRDLFGFQSGRWGGQRGHLILDDVFWPDTPAGTPLRPDPPAQRVPHVSIDRFTGGAADSLLFDERPLWQGDFPPLILRVTDAAQLSADAKKALHAALLDLIEGRLALGAGAGRGLGYFEAAPGAARPLECSAGPEWFHQPPTATPTAP
jgi:hypothetical protein